MDTPVVTVPVSLAGTLSVVVGADIDVGIEVVVDRCVWVDEGAISVVWMGRVVEVEAEDTSAVLCGSRRVSVVVGTLFDITVFSGMTIIIDVLKACVVKLSTSLNVTPARFSALTL